LETVTNTQFLPVIKYIPQEKLSILPQDPNILQLNKERDLFFGTLDKYPLLAGGGGKSQAVQAGAGPQPPSASPACASPSSVTPQHTGDHKPALCNN